MLPSLPLIAFAASLGFSPTSIDTLPQTVPDSVLPPSAAHTVTADTMLSRHLAGLQRVELPARRLLEVMPGEPVGTSDITVNSAPFADVPATALTSGRLNSLDPSQEVPATSLVKLLLDAPREIPDQDTIRRRRASVSYSDAYGTRAMIHRRLSWAMLPLFAASYFSGDKLFKDGSSSPQWVVVTHRATATGVAVLFTANAITGGMNLWAGRHDPEARKRRFIHSALFMAATAGFTYAGAVLADQAETSQSKRQDHRNLNLISMGLSTASVLVMLKGN